jgi:hypothetical protein
MYWGAGGVRVARVRRLDLKLWADCSEKKATEDLRELHNEDPVVCVVHQLFLR